MYKGMLYMYQLNIKNKQNKYNHYYGFLKSDIDEIINKNNVNYDVILRAMHIIPNKNFKNSNKYHILSEKESRAFFTSLQLSNEISLLENFFNLI